jgi:Uri superfamily endonuclease
VASKVTLSSIDRRLDDHIQQTKEYREEIKGEIAKVLSCLQDNGRPGLLTRVDRLEQTESKRVWHVRTLWAAVIAAFAQLFVRG